MDEDMGIRITVNSSDIDFTQAARLLGRNGIRRNAEDVRKAFENSAYAVYAVDGNTVAAVGRALSDRRAWTLVTDVAVLPGYERTGEALLEQMGLSDKADAYPFQLSGGQQQRVSIARALAMNPKILFFDEPTSALDPELTGEILRVIRKLAEKKMTMVIVTHEMAFARDVSDWVVFMNGGVIVEQGDPREVIDHPTHERTIQFLRRLQET